MIPDFVPIEMDHGMSIITAICIACIAPFIILIGRHMWIRQNKIEDTQGKQNDEIINIRVSLSGLESEVRGVSTMVHKIDNKLDQNVFAWANQQAMIKSLESKGP